jgi:hypothetical protein
MAMNLVFFFRIFGSSAWVHAPNDMYHYVLVIMAKAIFYFIYCILGLWLRMNLVKLDM